MNAIPLQSSIYGVRQSHESHDGFGVLPAAAISALVRTSSTNSNVWITNWDGSLKLADLTETDRSIAIQTGQWYKCWGQSKTLNTAAANVTVDAPPNHTVWIGTSSGGVLEGANITTLSGSVPGEPTVFRVFSIMPNGQTPQPPGPVDDPGNGNGGGGGGGGIDPMLILLGVGTVVVIGAAFFLGKS